MTLAVRERWKQSPARKKGIELAAVAILSCASGIRFESILRPNDPRSGFHTAKTQRRHSGADQWVRLRYRIVQHPIVALIIFPPFIFLLLYRIPFDTPRSWKKERWSVWLTNAALFGIFGTPGLALGFREVLLVQLPISIFATIFGVWLFSLQHRFEQVCWLRGTTGTLSSLRFVAAPS